MAVKNVKNGDLALVSSGRVDTDNTNAGLKSLINDGVNKGRENTNKTLGDVGTNQGVRTQKPATTAESVSGTSSAEYNSFNNLKYLKSVCTFSVDYFITAGVLTHAASVLRKGAFDDISKYMADLERRTKAIQEEANKTNADIIKKTIKTGKNSTVKSQVVELDPIAIEYDLLNIPWELIVPEDASASKNTVAALSQSSMTDIDSAINKSSKTHIPKFSLYIPAGKSQYACPKSVSHKGFTYLGSLTKPIFLPINPAASYGGLFGRILAQLSVVKARDFTNLNSAGALASSRVVVPTSFSDEEPEGSLLTLIPSLGDYASIVSPPLFYKSNAVQFGDNKSIVLDDEWKKGISSGSLFTTSDKVQYSDSGLVADEVIKHGTDGFTKAELKDRIGGKKSKLIAPYLRRITNEDTPQKAGNAPVPYEEDKAKDFTKLSDAPVSALIKPVPWKKIVSDKYNSTIGTQEIKAGKNLISPSDIPSFQFWMPFISSKAEDADGSAIYSYLEPTSLASFKNLRVIYTPSAPIGFIQAGVTYTGFGQYINSQGVDNLNNYPALMCDPLIQKYGIGGFGSTEDTKNTYLLPVSGLSKTIFDSVTPLFSIDTKKLSQEFPITHKYGIKNISLHSAVFRSLMKSFSEYSIQAIESIKSSISLSMLKSKSKVKTDDPKQFKINLNHLMLLGTPFETISDERQIDVYVEENSKSILGTDQDRVYNRGTIDKVVKVEMNEIISAQIHVGKTINAKGIDDNIQLTSNNVRKVLVDSKIENGFIYEGPGSFMTDIQPGEVLTKKKVPSEKAVALAAVEAVESASATQKGTTASTTPEINEIEYGVDGKLSNSVIFSEDLIDINAKNRINAVDLISSFMGSGSYSDLQQTDKNNQGDLPRKDPQAILSASLVQSFNSLLGSETIPRLSPSWKSVGLASQPDNISADPYVFTQEANDTKNLGLFSALGVLLKTPEILYLEHFQDVKTEPLCANSLIFLEKKYPDESGDYGIYTKTSTIDDYITISGSGGNEKIPVKNLSTGSSTLESKHPNIVHEKIDVETREGFYTYEPWGGFEKGFENYSSRLDKFVLMTSNDNAAFTSNQHIYKKVSDYVGELISSIVKESSLSESRATSIFTQGEYKISSSGSDIDSVLTKLFAVSKLENVTDEYLGSDAALMTAIFSAIKNKVMAAAVYTAAEHMKKFTISSDVDLARLIKAIRNKKSVVFTLNSDIQTIDDATANQIRAILLEPTMPQSQAEIIVSDQDEQRKIIKVIAQAIGCFYLRKLIYKKGFPADAPSYTKLNNLLNGVNTLYLKSKADPEKLKTIPRYDVVDISDLGKLISSVQEMKNSEGFSKADGIGMTFTEAKIPFSSWYDVTESKTFFGNEPVVEYFVPNRTDFPIKIPLCIVRPVKRKDEDIEAGYTVYEFVTLDNETLDSFARGLKLGETDWLDNPNGYKLLVKSVSPNWLSKKLIANESSLEKVSMSVRHAALINNILDYIGFCLQCISEVASVKKDLSITPVRPNPLDARERNRSIRRSRIELGADYVGNNVSGSGDNPQEEKGIRTYLLKLNDFSNMVRITQEKGIKITKMFPVGLKDLNPDSPQKDLSDSSVVETKVIDLGSFSGSQSKYYGTFMRPGYGLPDLVEGIGYRCVIAKTSSILYNDFKPKRFAFLNNLKSGKPSLKLSRMIENAVGSSGFNDVIKASEWSNARLEEKTTSIKDQISSFTISNKFKSSYDGFNPTGMNEASIFDIKIGYVSTRPLFSGAVTAKIKTPEIPLEFKGAMENINLSYEGSQPANLLYRLTKGFNPDNVARDNTTRNTLNASIGKSLYTDINLITKLNARANSSFKEVESKVSLIENLFRQLATFRIPVKTEINLIDELKNSVDATKAKIKDKVQYKNNYDIVIQKIVSLINEDKLRDCGFIEGSHLSFTGRIDETPIIGNSPYPYIYPGGFTESDIKIPSLQKLNSISGAGPSNEALYDAHPLSFMTSPSAIGLSKRRSLFTGMNVLKGLIKEDGNYKFIKKQDAINPYAGIYFFRTNTTFDENLVLANKRKIEGRPDTYRVVIVPDFPSSEKSSKDLAISELTSVNSSNISAESIAAFFGSGTLLNGEFYDQLKSEKGKSKKEDFKSMDSRGNSNTKYTASMFNTILKHLKLLYTHAKSKEGEEFYSILNGSVFLKPGTPASIGIPNSERINKFSDVLFSTEKLTLELNEGKLLTDAIVSVFGNAENTNLYFPMALEGDTLYCTGAGISYLQVLYHTFGKKGNNAKGKNNDGTKIESAIKILIDRMKPKSNNDEFNDFSNSDLFSIMAGGIYTKSFANADGKLSQTKKPGNAISSVNRLSYTPNISRANSQNNGIFISAQIYIGYSKKDADIFPMAVIDVPSGKSSKKLLAATRTFGEGVKISNIVNSNMDLNYAIEDVVQFKSKVKNNNKKVSVSNLEKTKNKYLFETGVDAVNIFGIARLWLAYNWFADATSNASIKTTNGVSKPISDITLYDIIHVDTEYFVKTLGPILSANKDKKTVDFDIIDPGVKGILGPQYKNKLVSTPDAKLPPYSSVPFLAGGSFGIGGIINKVLTEKETFDSDKLNTNDFNVDLKLMGLFWSLFSMKVFVGSSSIGVEIPPAEFLDESNSLENITPTKKPTLGAISTEKSKVYTDIVSWNSSEAELDNYVSKLVISAGKWNKAVSVDSDNEKLQIISANAADADSKIPKLVAGNDAGLSIMSFEKN